MMLMPHSLVELIDVHYEHLHPNATKQEQDTVNEERENPMNVRHLAMKWIFVIE